MVKTTISNTSNSYGSVIKRGAIANNGKMIFSSGKSIVSSDVAINNSITTTNLLYRISGSTQRLVKASLDGSRIYIIPKCKVDLIQSYDASSNTLNQFNVFEIADSLTVSRTGERLIVDEKVYDSNLSLIGSLPTS